MAVPGAIPRACFGLDDPDCARVGDAALAMLSGRQAVWVEVAHAGCPGEAPCPRNLAPGAGARATVHFQDGQRPVVVRFRNDVDRLVPEMQDDVFAVARAASTPAPKGAPFAFTLGHCGLASPIDFDSSLWLPVGFVPEHGDAINAADGFVTIVAPTDAVLRTRGGLEVTLRRMGGAVNVRLCS